jgi:hypothetical protein
MGAQYSLNFPSLARRLRLPVLEFQEKAADRIGHGVFPPVKAGRLHALEAKGFGLSAGVMAAGTEKAYFGSLEFGPGNEPFEAFLKKLPGVIIIREPGPGKADGPQNLAFPAGGIFPEFLKNLRNPAGRIILGIEKIQIYRNKKIRGSISGPGRPELVQIDAGGVLYSP